MKFYSSKLILIVCGSTCLIYAKADAAVTAIASQQGNDVVITASGYINTLGLLPIIVDPTTVRAVISPQSGGIGFGSVAGADSQKFRLPTIPMAPYGTGPDRFADLASGSIFGIGSSSGMGELSVPTGYVSGSPLAATMTYQNSTLDSLGLSPGSHVLSWTVGTEADRFTLVVVPEPSSSLLIALPAALFACSRKRGKPSSRMTP